MRSWLPALGCLAAAGCVAGDFSGDDGRIRFSANVSRDFQPWSPRQPVAVGAELFVRAVDQQPNDAGHAIPPGATPVLPDGGALEFLDAGVDFLVARAGTAGATRLDWVGPIADHFTVTAEPAARAALEDPILARIVQPSTLPIPRDGGQWADVGSDFLLATGADLYLEGALFGADGGRLAHAPGQLQGRATSGRLGVAPLEFGLVLSHDGGSGETADVALAAGGVDLGAVRVRTAPASAVTRVDLQYSVVQPGILVLRATSRVDGGEPLWQAHVRWAFDPVLREVDVQSGAKTPKRQDLMVLSWDVGDAGTVPAGVYVGVGSVETELHFELPVRGAPALPAVVELPAGKQPGCGCGAGPASASLWLLLAALWRQRRTR